MNKTFRKFGVGRGFVKLKEPKRQTTRLDTSRLPMDAVRYLYPTQPHPTGILAHPRNREFVPSYISITASLKSICSKMLIFNYLLILILNVAFFDSIRINILRKINMAPEPSLIVLCLDKFYSIIPSPVALPL